MKKLIKFLAILSDEAGMFVIISAATFFYALNVIILIYLGEVVWEAFLLGVFTLLAEIMVFVLLLFIHEYKIIENIQKAWKETYGKNNT